MRHTPCETGHVLSHKLEAEKLLESKGCGFFCLISHNLRKLFKIYVNMYIYIYTVLYIIIILYHMC